jgi:hypothetical protein
MPDRRSEHAKQQMRELGQAVRKAAREVDRAYPNTMRGDRIVSDFSQQMNRIVQNDRQHDERPLISCSTFTHSNQSPSDVIVALVLWAVSVFVLLLLIVLL